MRSVLLLLLFLFLYFISLAQCDEFLGMTDHQLAEDMETNSGELSPKYDFIVVGTGAVGSVLASRLACDTTAKVLVLEGGAIGTGQRDIGGTDYVASVFKTDPNTGKRVLDTPLTRYDVPTMDDTIRSASDELDNMWNITAIGSFYKQARVIGGNMATNGINWIFPSWTDLDEWNLVNYTSAKLKPYFKRIENATETGYGNSPVRGNHGRINIRIPTFEGNSQLLWRDACLAAGYTLQGDINSGDNQEGVYEAQTNIRNGIRSSASVEYLRHALKHCGDNLTVRARCTVTKVIRKGGYTGVQYVNKNGNTRKIFASKEVLLGAGDLQNAKILLHSGVGPEHILKNAGYTDHDIVVKNDKIGQYIRNHQRVSMTFFDPNNENPTYFATPSISLQYARTGTGIMEAGSKGGFKLYFKTDPLLSSPDIYAQIGVIAGNTPSTLYPKTFTVTLYLINNLGANGTLTISSTDPLAASTYTANTFLMEYDRRTLAKAILKMRLIIGHWPTGGITEQAPGPSLDTEEELMQYIYDNPSTTCHYYGSSPMGPAPSDPVDEQMKLKGIPKLRVVGPSVIPNKVSPGMQALALALAEKAADMIKDEYY